MTDVWVIVCMGASVYALRLAGFLLPDRVLPQAWVRSLSLVPVALLAALVVSSLSGPGNSGLVGLIAIAGAGLIAFYTGRLWACILGGMALYWLLRLL